MTVVLGTMDPPHPYYAGTEHVGFSPAGQALLAPSAMRRAVFGESHEGERRGVAKLPCKGRFCGHIFSIFVFILLNLVRLPDLGFAKIASFWQFCFSLLDISVQDRSASLLSFMKNADFSFISFFYFGLVLFRCPQSLVKTDRKFQKCFLRHFSPCIVYEGPLGAPVQRLYGKAILVRLHSLTRPNGRSCTLPVDWDQGCGRGGANC